MLVNLNQLVQPRRLANDLAKVIPHARATRVPQRKYLVPMQHAEVHLGALRNRGTFCKVVEVHARHHIVAVGEDALRQRLWVPHGAPHDVAGHHDVIAVKLTVEPADIHFATVQDAHALPHLGPGGKVVEVLEVTHVRVGERGARMQHVAEVLRASQQLKTRIPCRQHIFANRRIRMARVQRVRMRITKVPKQSDLPQTS